MAQTLLDLIAVQAYGVPGMQKGVRNDKHPGDWSGSELKAKQDQAREGYHTPKGVVGQEAAQHHENVARLHDSIAQHYASLGKDSAAGDHEYWADVHKAKAAAFRSGRNPD